VMLGAIILASFSLPFATYLIPKLGVFSALFPLAYLLALFLGIVYIFSKALTKSLRNKKKTYFTAILPQFSPLVNGVQLLLSLFSFFIFGLGSYFTALSIAYLNPQHVVGFISFFIFSFFVGYISLITPMGLGVREGVITAGLSKLMTSTTAGVVAIFIRIIFIISELLAIGGAYIWFKSKNETLRTIEKYLYLHQHEVTLTIGIALYSIYFTTASFLRFANFFTGRFDLGNMDQTVWNTLHGRIFMFTNPDGTEVLSRLAFHADVILVLLAPFYALWRDPRMLLFLQTIVLACGAFFVYAIAEKILKNKNVALTFATVYLLNPAIQYTNLYDFHAVTFATTFLLGTYYFAIEKKYKHFFLFAILSGLCKEQIWLIIGLFGLYFFIVQKKKVLGVSVFVLFMGLTYYIISYLIPQARGGNHFALAFYSDFGDSPINIVKTIILSPQKVILTILEPSRLEYLKRLLLPIGFFPLFAPFVLIFAAPDLLINLLSSNTNFHQIYYQYTATVTPFLFIAGIYGVVFVKKRFYVSNILIVSYLFIVGFLGAYLYGPLPGAQHPSIDMFTQAQSDRKFIAQYLSRIPRQYSVAATNNIGAHLSHRRYLFTIPTGMEKADVIAFLLGDKFAQPSPMAQQAMIDTLLKNPQYILRIQRGNFFVFEKIATL
jgi:uncharacterized membrane protein